MSAPAACLVDTVAERIALFSCLRSGEYLFDHRNATLRRWLVDDYFGGPSCLGSKHVDGLILDDDWTAAGPTEENQYSAVDMGLSPAEVAEIGGNWSISLKQLQAEVVQARASFLSLSGQAEEPQPQPEKTLEAEAAGLELTEAEQRVLQQDPGGAGLFPRIAGRQAQSPAGREAPPGGGDGQRRAGQGEGEDAPGRTGRGSAQGGCC